MATRISCVHAMQELYRQGLEDVEYLAMLDRLAGLADKTHRCGYEDAVLRGPSARVLGENATEASFSCCASLDDAKAALNAVDEVTWGVSPNWSIKSAMNENVTLLEPYTFDPAVLHRVLDGVARAIELVQQKCGGAAE